MAEKVFVTGGTGLLGGYLLRALLARGAEVRALHRGAQPEALSQEERMRVEWVEGDILDVTVLSECLEGVSEVYHCAGMVSFNPAKAERMRRVNVEGTANVVNACLAAPVRKLVHVSSVSALGRKRDGQTVREDVKWDEEANLSAYGNSKYLAEMEVWRGIGEGLGAAIVNPSIILGVGDWHKGSSAMFRNAFREFPWYTEGGTGIVDARDVAALMVMLMESDISGERFIVSAENRRYREIFTAMAEAFGKRPPRLRASRTLGALVWRWEWLKGLFSSSDPLLTRETSETAQTSVAYDSTKILSAFPGFGYRPFASTIADHCREYLVKYGQGADAGSA